MQSSTIKLLIDKLPVHADYANRELRVREMRDAEAKRYAKYYKDLAFAWHFAEAMVEYDLSIPAALTGDDYHLLLAFQMQTDPLFKHEAVEHAYSIHTDRDAYDRNLIEAALLSTNSTIEEASSYVGIPVETIEAYEKLFFNALDRKADAYIIAQHLYPNSRIETFQDDHLMAVDQGLLMKRAGYHNGIEDVIYFAGFQESTLLNLAGSSNTAAKLEGMLMANGYILARNGWANQRGVGISQAKALIAAAKQGGEATASGDTLPGMSELLMGELKTVKTAEALEQLEYRRNLDDDGRA